MTTIIQRASGKSHFYSRFYDLDINWRTHTAIMALSTHQPILIPAKTAVLLVFIPAAPTQESVGQSLAVTKLVSPLQQKLGSSVRVLKIDETMHPDVVRSFDVRQFPAFILVQQGIELWRQEGISLTGEDVVNAPNLMALIGTR